MSDSLPVEAGPAVPLELRVARIGKPHGLNGQCTVQVLTDEPHRRFALGAQLITQPAHHGPLTVSSSQVINGRWVLGFDGVLDRSGAQQLRDVILLTVVDANQRPDDPQEFYDHHLRGCHCLIEGQEVGQVRAVLHGGAQDLLEVVDHHGKVTLVPFVEALVPLVDITARRMVLTPPPGLFEEPPA